MNKIKVQSYNIALQSVPEENNIIGSFVYTGEHSEIVGFISKRLPDCCAEITLFIPLELPLFDGMDEIKETISQLELRKRMQFAANSNPTFKEFIKKLMKEKE